MAKSPKSKPKTPALTPARPRARKARPSFDVAAAAAPAHVGWVYRSDEGQAHVEREPSMPTVEDAGPAILAPVFDRADAEPPSGDASASWIVKKHALLSAAAGLVPVPLVDMAAIAALQVHMVNELAKHYGVAMSRESGKTAVATLIGSVAPPAMGPSICKAFLRRVPVVGPVVCFFSVSTFASAATYAIGRIFMRHFERGGSVEDFDPAAAQADFAAQLAS